MIACLVMGACAGGLLGAALGYHTGYRDALSAHRGRPWRNERGTR